MDKQVGEQKVGQESPKKKRRTKPPSTKIDYSDEVVSNLDDPWRPVGWKQESRAQELEKAKDHLSDARGFSQVAAIPTSVREWMEQTEYAIAQILDEVVHLSNAQRTYKCPSCDAIQPNHPTVDLCQACQVSEEEEEEKFVDAVICSVCEERPVKDGEGLCKSCQKEAEKEEDGKKRPRRPLEEVQPEEEGVWEDQKVCKACGRVRATIGHEACETCWRGNRRVEDPSRETEIVEVAAVELQGVMEGTARKRRAISRRISARDASVEASVSSPATPAK